MNTNEQVMRLLEILESTPDDSWVEAPEGKQRFIISLMSSVALSAVEKVRDGSVPKDWDGYELRRWLADLMEEQVIVKMSRGRLGKYRNARYISNL